MRVVVRWCCHVRTKKDERIIEKQREFLVQQRRQGKWFLGWGMCNAKGKRLMSYPLNF